MTENLLEVLLRNRKPQDRILSLPGGIELSTADVRTHTGRLAAALADIGVSAGDRVSFKLEKSAEVLYLAHACLQIGAILHPLNLSYTDSEITSLLSDVEPRLLVCNSGEERRLQALAPVRVETLDPGMGGSLGRRSSTQAPRLDYSQTSSADTAAILYTSGTTGRPKGACITHGSLAESALALVRVWGLTSTDRLLHVLPLFHAHGLLTAINTMFASGGSIHLLPRFDVDEFVTALPGSTVFMGVPTHYVRLTGHAKLRAACSSLRLAISGSAPLPGDVADRFQQITGLPIIQRYGSTEATIITAMPPSAPVANSVGFALPGVEIRVREKNGATAGTGIGEIETRGHNVFAGYWRDHAATQAVLARDGWYATGDIAEIDASGAVRILGRSKDLIISGGLNVYPREVEDAIDRALPAAESAVFGVPHPDFGEAVVAAVEGANVADFDEQRLITNLRDCLAGYKIPKRIFHIRELPRNKMGKVMKSALRAAYQNLFVEGV